MNTEWLVIFIPGPHCGLNLVAFHIYSITVALPAPSHSTPPSFTIYSRSSMAPRFLNLPTIHALLVRIFPPFGGRKGEPTVKALVIKQLSFERIAA